MRANFGLNKAANLKTGEPTPASEKGIRADPACDVPNPELEAHAKTKEGRGRVADSRKMMAEIRDLQGSIENMNRKNEDLSRRAIAAEAARADVEALHEATRRERSAIQEMFKETSSKEQRKGKRADNKTC